MEKLILLMLFRNMYSGRIIRKYKLVSTFTPYYLRRVESLLFIVVLNCNIISVAKSLQYNLLQ